MVLPHGKGWMDGWMAANEADGIGVRNPRCVESRLFIILEAIR